VLETGCVYIVPLQESLSLPKGVSAAANPKSSTGRLDIFTRVIADYAQEFDTIPDGYSGPLFAEISPRTFSMAPRSSLPSSPALCGSIQRRASTAWVRRSSSGASSRKA